MTPSQARRLLLAGQALLGAPPRDAAEAVDRLGFVQMDSINIVERAHHLTLGSRLPGYRRPDFDALLEGERRLFEHWTHDASAIPLAFYPQWKRRFPLRRQHLLASAWWRERVGEQVETLLKAVRTRIREEGPLMSADFEHPKAVGGSAWWGWKPAKAALEFLWHTGELAVARRVNFHKVYDLAERVLPAHHGLPVPSRAAHLDWACASALDRLGAATPRELAAFWEAVAPAEAEAWCARAVRTGRAVPVEIQGEPPRPAVAVPDWEARLREAGEPGDRMVLLCPFDPILRDRARALRLFGFDYRFEAFVPQAKRQYGYYVLPILEGERLVGRLDPKFQRDRGVLEVQGLWWEPGIRPGKARLQRLERAAEDLAARIGAARVELPRG